MTQLDLGMRIILESRRTGERFVQTTDQEWTDALKRWQHQIRDARAELDKIDTRESWDEYRSAQRAMYARIAPCPMPWDHCMFSDPDGYNMTRVR